MQTLVKPLLSYSQLLESDNFASIENARQYLTEISRLDWEFESEDLVDYWQEQLDAIGFYGATIHYSGFYSQGDGLSFTSAIDLVKLFTSIENRHELSPILCETLGEFVITEHFQYLLDFDIENYVTFSIKRTSSRYVHEQTCHVNFDDGGFQLPEDSPVYDVLRDLEDSLESLRLSLCHAIYRDLEKSYDYLHSDERLIELSEESGIRFFEDGEVYAE